MAGNAKSFNKKHKKLLPNPVSADIIIIRDQNNFKNEYGRFPEWPKGADCKSVVNDFGGSNPPPPTNI